MFYPAANHWLNGELLVSTIFHRFRQGIERVRQILQHRCCLQTGFEILFCECEAFQQLLHAEKIALHVPVVIESALHSFMRYGMLVDIVVCWLCFFSASQASLSILLLNLLRYYHRRAKGPVVPALLSASLPAYAMSIDFIHTFNCQHSFPPRFSFFRPNLLLSIPGSNTLN